MTAAPRTPRTHQSPRSALKYTLHQQIDHAVEYGTIKKATGGFLHKILRMRKIVDDGERQTRSELAALIGKSVSSLKLYLRDGQEADFIIVERSGRIRFRALEIDVDLTPTYDELVAEATQLASENKLLEAGLVLRRAAALKVEPAQNEAEDCDPSPSFFALEESTNCLKSVNLLPDPSFKRSDQEDQKAGSPPTPHVQPGRRRSTFFHREEMLETPTVHLLRDHDIRDRSTLRELATRPVSDVHAAVAVLQSRYGSRWGPGLLVHCLLYGLWGTPPAAADRQGTDYATSDYCPDCGQYTFGGCEHARREPHPPPGEARAVCPVCHELFTTCHGVHGWAASP